MTKKEALQILAILKAAYPNFYTGTIEEATGTVSVWCMQFNNIPAEIVLMAVHKLISTNKFPPAVSEVKEKITSIHWEAWQEISKRQQLGTENQAELNHLKWIYEATCEYGMSNKIEPSLSQMLGCQLLQIESGKRG